MVKWVSSERIIGYIASRAIEFRTRQEQRAINSGYTEVKYLNETIADILSAMLIVVGCRGKLWGKYGA